MGFVLVIAPHIQRGIKAGSRNLALQRMLTDIKRASPGLGAG